MTTTPPIRLLGDLACPWTYLTLTALVQTFGAGLRLEWHPFLLHTTDFARQRERLAGPVTLYARRLSAPFVADGLAQPLDGPLAHGIVLAAAAEERTVEALQTLFDARFARAQPLGDAAAISAAVHDRIDAPSAERWLAHAAASTAIVERATRAARLAGVSEIPLAVVANAYVIGGLQPAEAYRALVELAHVEAACRG